MSYNLEGHAIELPKRGISQKTCEKYKIYRDSDKLRFHYFTRDGTLTGAKIKTKGKSFTFDGDTPGTLFGQHLFRTGKKLVITEGELDAASCFEAQPGWQCVSVPTGAAGARKSVGKNLDWVNEFEKVVIFFDNDEAGQKAAYEVASIIRPGKAYVGFLEDYKDASEALQNKDSEAIRAILNYNHELYKPDGIVEAKSLLQLVTTPNPPNDYDYPIQGLQKLLHGVRRGELITITSGSGQGKSSLCRYLATHFLQTGERVGYLALEESNRRTALGLMSNAVGKNLALGEHTHDELTEAFDSSINNWNLYLFDGFGSFDPDTIYNRIEYLASGLDCNIIFLDHLSILMSGLDGDERQMIDKTMTRLRSLVERTNISLFLVSHLKRTSGDQNHEEGARVTLGQLRGSAAIAQLSDGVIALERNQQSESGQSPTTVRVIKNRHSGETGVACTLSYDLDTCKFNETKPDEPFNPATDF
jgi:twinkle protein